MKKIINFDNHEVIVDTQIHDYKGSQCVFVIFNHAGCGLSLYAVPVPLMDTLELERIHRTEQDTDDDIIEAIKPYEIEGFLTCFNYN